MRHISTGIAAGSPALSASDIKVVSLGVGVYRQPQKKLFFRVLFRFDFAQLVLKVLEPAANAKSNNALSRAILGALVGSLAGPWGAVIGAAIEGKNGYEKKPDY